MSYVITCADEGVQVNEGTRLGFVGAGFRLNGFHEAVIALKNILKTDISIASSEECDWIKQQLDLSNWEQVTASTQQHIEAVADREDLLYAGFIPFADPKELAHGVKAHMVRPREVHIANKICFTLAGGEQTYNLGCFLLSAEWVHAVDQTVARELLETQVQFCKKLAGRDDLEIIFEQEGELGAEVAQKNSVVLEELGYISTQK